MARHCLKCGKRAYSDYCVRCKPRKRINPIGKTAKKNKATTEAWRAQNTEFVCYLQISPMCLVWLDEQTAVPEHTIPKGRGQEFAHDITKIRAACTFCNQLKGSRTLESLAKEFPHLLVLTKH